MLIFVGALACIAGMWLIGKMLSTGGRRVLVQVKYCVIISLVLLAVTYAKNVYRAVTEPQTAKLKTELIIYE